VNEPIVLKETSFLLESDLDVTVARGGVRDWARELGFSVLDMTKVVTAASELARNVVVHGAGGTMRLAVVHQGARRGLRLVFSDNGPGITDLGLAMKDGYSSAGGMGIGLPGAKRLVNEFDIHSNATDGTRITVLRWKP
jgi:serine/threonine-protein kinase RsbT